MRATPKPTARPRRWSWAAPIPPTLARSTISLSPTRRSSRWCRTPSRAAFAARSQWCGGCRAHADQGADQDNRKRLALALGPRPVPHRKQQRHHQRRKRRGAELRLLPERRHHAAARRRGESQSHVESLERLRQLHVHRRNLSELSDVARREQSDGNHRSGHRFCHHQRHSRRSYSGNSRAAPQARRRI